MADIAKNIETAKWRKQHLVKMKHLVQECQGTKRKRKEEEDRLKTRKYYFDKYYNKSTNVIEKRCFAANGLVSEVHHANFCSEIDFLVWAMFAGVSCKSVLGKDIANTVDDILGQLPKGKLSDREQELWKAVSDASKTLVVECGMFAAMGSSPDALLAAASNLATNVADLLKSVKIRPCHPEDFGPVDDPEKFPEDQKLPPPLTLHVIAEQLRSVSSSDSDINEKTRLAIQIDIDGLPLSPKL